MQHRFCPRTYAREFAPRATFQHHCVHGTHINMGGAHGHDASTSHVSGRGDGETHTPGMIPHQNGRRPRACSTVGSCSCAGCTAHASSTCAPISGGFFGLLFWIRKDTSQDVSATPSYHYTHDAYTTRQTRRISSTATAFHHILEASCYCKLNITGSGREAQKTNRRSIGCYQHCISQSPLDVCKHTQGAMASAIRQGMAHADSVHPITSKRRHRRERTL